jgi:hypothetical protein
MAGYSGTPLSQKLGLKPGLMVAFPALPDDLASSLGPALDRCAQIAEPAGRVDLVVLLGSSAAGLRADLARWAAVLAPAGAIWLGWPKRSSGVATDLDEATVRAIGLDSGLVDVKVCAISGVWSGLKFVRRLRDRPGAPAPRGGSAGRCRPSTGS